MSIFLRGSQQIRTAVDGFADRYLATRSGNHSAICECKDNAFFERIVILSVFYG